MDDKKKKNKKIEVLCNESQYIFITEKAKGHAMSNSEFGLFTMMNCKIDVSVGKDPALAKIERAVDLLDRGMIDEAEFRKLKEIVLRNQEKK